MLTFFAVVFVFSIVIMVHELGHFFMARRVGVKVERFSLGFGRVLWSKRKGDTEYVLSAIPFGGYVKMAGEDPSDTREGKPWEFYAKPAGMRFWILCAGAVVNYLLAFLIFCFIVPTSRVGIVLNDMPAYAAGVKTNDKIIAVNGKSTNYWYEVLDIISKSKEDEMLSLQIERDNKRLNITVAPTFLVSKNIFGKEIKKPKIGIGYYGDVQVLKASPIEYLITGFRQTLDNTLLTYRFIWYLITGKVSVQGSVTGPVGIAIIIGKAARIGLAYLIYLIAHINLALAIFNLMPFPVLDGGHIMFLGLEKIRKKALAPKTQEAIQYMSISVLILFFLFVSYNDVIFWFVKK